MDAKEILSEILLRLDEKDVNNFKQTTYEFQYLVGEVEKDEEYWRKKLSNYLEFEVFSSVGSWKIMRNNVLKFKKDFYEMIKLNYVEIVAGLIKEGFDSSHNDNYAIQLASRNGHLEVVKLLLQDPRVDPSAKNNYAIRWTSRKSRLEVVKLLLQDPRVDPSVDNNYAIGYASENGHSEVVKLLLQDPRVDPSDDDNYAILLASDNGHSEVVKLLLQDERVKNSLSEIRLANYQKQIK